MRKVASGRSKAMEELKMSGSIASYDQLVKQVEALKKENTHLRQELEDNSNHLSKLENETSDMKVVLKHLQGKLEQEAKVMVSSGQMEVLDQLKALQMDITSLYNLKFHPPALLPEPVCQDHSPEHSLSHSAPLQRKDSMGDLGRATIRLLEELDRERCFLLSEIEKEEKEKLWYYTQLQSLSKRLDELPHVETFSMQMDLIRQQLEFEAQHIRTLMEERFGTTDEMVQRAQIRASRLEQIDKELMEAQDKVQPSEQPPSGKLRSTEGDGRLDMATHSEEAKGQLGSSKVEVVFWLLSMLATRDKEDMSRTLLAMSSSQESCLAMRKSGCLPLLIQILHDSDREPSAPDSPGATGKDCRMRANAALHNIIFSQPDEGQAKREMRVLHVLEQIRSYSETCWDWLRMQKEGTKIPEGGAAPVPIEPQICQATCAIMKLSFDEEYRRAMNELGGLQAIAELLQVDYEMHKMTNDALNLALRRYTGMALTNLTFGDVVNKATLCSRQRCMQAIVDQLASDSEELHQVVSSILRNLSWRADMNSKKVLREVGSVSALMQCALRASKESTLKSVLSALWNLSAHSTENKTAICMVEGALGFLVSTLTYKCQSNSLAIIESGGGILRNVSSLIATREDYRQILRDHNCLQTLLQHLKSHSLTIVSNACGTLWNLSARSPKDQELLWDLGAVSMLRNLVHSKHKMIAMGSTAALRNLLANRPLKYKDAMVISPGSCMPSLYMRKQKALEAELDAQHLAETFDTMEKQTMKKQSVAKKPMRHMDSLAKDYASDSGCFDDDEVPNVSSSTETGNASVLSMFLNSSFLQSQTLPRTVSQRRGPEPEKDQSGKSTEAKKVSPLLVSQDNDVSVVAEKLANKITTTVAKIDKLVEDITTLHTSSDDSFSLSSEDHCLDWQYGLDEVHEARAQSCSPCRLSDTSGIMKRESLSRAHTLLRLKNTYTSLSNDSLNSGSTSDGYCPKEHMRPCTRTTFLDFKDELHRYQKRPSRLDLKNILMSRPEKMEPPEKKQQESNVMVEKPEKEKLLEQAKVTRLPPDPDVAEKESECKKKEGGRQLDPDPKVHTIKLSPSYQHVPLIDNNAIASGTMGVLGTNSYYPSLSMKTTDNLNKVPEKLTAAEPTKQKRLQKYSMEDTPICFSRCSSLSSISSADNVLDGQSHSENEMDTDSSLEIIEVEEVEEAQKNNQEKKAKQEAEPLTSSSQPIAIPFPKKDKMFLRGASPSRHEDLTPSSSSENYIQETPLVMSRCSSVSSLGSFESPSIASSIQSEPCSEMISGTVSPSELPDSPGQTMPPSRSKTPQFELNSQPEKEASQFNIQWENNVKKFMDITDFKERFQMPQDLDSMVYFTVEKPNENFSCASSLSALPLHEHYVQKDVELKLIPPFPDRSGLNFMTHEKRDDERAIEGQRKLECLELTSDEDIEILRECINSAMPSRFRKIRTSLVSGLPGQVLNPQSKKSMQVPVYMLVPANSHLGIPKHRWATVTRPNKDYLGNEDSFTDSAEGTPVNFSSAASLSDETLQYPMKDEGDSRHCSGKRKEVMGAPMGGLKREIRQLEQSSCRIGRITSSHSTPTKMASSSKHKTGSNHTSPLRATRAQSAESRRGNIPLRNLELPFLRQGSSRASSEGNRSKKKEEPQENSSHDSDGAFPSFCHTTPTEEAVYCFYENDSDDLVELDMKNSPKRKPNLASKGQKKECWVKKEPELSSSQQLHAKNKMAPHLRSNLIADETPPCYSLSSSLSSLSDLELYGTGERTQMSKIRANRQLTMNRRQGMKAAVSKGRDSSASSLSYNSDNDLLQKAIGLSGPKKRRHSAKRRNTEKEQKGLKAKEWKPDGFPDEIASEKGSDLDSVDWKAIQEGANSIVTWLHQATSSFGKETSSESDSILSFMSGLSASSALQLSLDRRDKTRGRKGPTGGVEKKNLPKSFQDGKNLNETRGAGSRNKTEKNVGQQKPLSNLPVVFRGRTVIYMPDAAKESPMQSSRSTPKKTGGAPKQEIPEKNLNLNQPRSRSLHRPGKISEMVELMLPKRSATPPARMNRAPSSGSSRTSTPSQPNQKKLTSPSQQPNRQMPSREAGKTSGSTTPVGPAPKPVQKSPVSKQHKTQKSPVRIPFMQKPVKKTLPMRNTMPTLEERGGNGSSELRPKANGKGILQANRLNLMRMSSARSLSSDSHQSGFLRQLTFIKESPSLRMRQRSEVSSSGSLSSLSQGASPRRGRLGLPTVFLCSSRCDDLKVDKPTGPSQRPVISRTPLPSQSPSAGGPPRLPRRTSSESPSRLPVKPNNVPPEPFKRYSSSPQINIIKRAASPTSTPLDSPEPSSGRKKNEEVSKLPVIPPAEKGTENQRQRQQQQPQPQPQPPPPQPQSQPQPQQQQPPQQLAMMKGTWKRIRDEDIPHILKSTLPSTALPLVSAWQEEESDQTPEVLQPKTSDAVVQTEDFSTTKTNSSTSPTLETQKVVKIPPDSYEGDGFALAKATTPSISFTHEGSVGSHGNFPSSRHSSPSRAVRVTPFNYTPSPMVEPTVKEKQVEKTQV
ncbi:adenomatous polyposis coli protein 2 isoform X2 [Pantherophis guttatus]|uniref:Adenomatous polyposis coli protein 2 n=1 Tax=Pantherophis guttatus TaxID=94885 RepID=A0A6P9CH89_PANGU|nr:adenomatous polyposis coli protein 2 isoform X2 [Pantherophis guttatus]